MRLPSLGKNWKTITGAFAWALAHAGVIGAIVDLVHPGAGAAVAGQIAAVAAGLAAYGAADKLNRYTETKGL